MTRVNRHANYWFAWLALLILGLVVIGLNDPLHLYSSWSDAPDSTFADGLRFYWVPLGIAVVVWLVGLRPRLELERTNILIVNPVRSYLVRRDAIQGVDARVGYARFQLTDGSSIVSLGQEEWTLGDATSRVEQMLQAVPQGSEDSSGVSSVKFFSRLTWEDGVFLLVFIGYPLAASFTNASNLGF